MANAKIYDIDFSCQYDVFMNDLDDYLNHTNSDIKATFTETATKNGKYMYKIEITNNSYPGMITTALFEKNPNNGDIILAPTGFRSFGGTFYKTEGLNEDEEGTVEDTSLALMDYLAYSASKHNGKFVCKTTCDDIMCIINGKSKTAKECIVDSNGNVYGAKEVNSVSLADGGSMVSYATKLPEWNKERRADDPDFDSILTDTTTTLYEKYTLIGKYVMMLRINDEITSEEFKDLFVQAGAADGYINDKTLNTIYKLLKN